MKNLLRILAATLLAGAHLAAEQNPIESELFPPDFLFEQREALGLSDTQLQDLQAIVQEVQPKFESLKGQLEDRAKAFKEILHQAKPDLAQTEEKLRTMLVQENEMKVLQVRLMLNLRNKLTPEQVEKARQLRPQFTTTSNPAASNPADGLVERLQGKFEKLRAAIEARAASGEPPVELVTKARELQALVRSNKPLEAERQLDALLATLPAAKPKP